MVYKTEGSWYFWSDHLSGVVIGLLWHSSQLIQAPILPSSSASCCFPWLEVFWTTCMKWKTFSSRLTTLTGLLSVRLVWRIYQQQVGSTISFLDIYHILRIYTYIAYHYWKFAFAAKPLDHHTFSVIFLVVFKANEFLTHEGYYVPDENGLPIGQSVSRGDVARFMLSLLSNNAWMKKAVAIITKWVCTSLYHYFYITCQRAFNSIYSVHLALSHIEQQRLSDGQIIC